MAARTADLSPVPPALRRLAAAQAAYVARAPAWLPYALALLIGLALAAWAFPLDALVPAQHQPWPLDGDWQQHVVGQRYFIGDAWRWPLLETRLLQWPDGVNIALTDSIPLAALAAKLLRHLLPPGFHAIFVWMALSWVLQPVAAVFALRSAGERRLLPALAVAVLAVSMPSWLFRIGHPALTAHFLILLALGLYFRQVRGNAPRWPWTALLLVASLLVHPYLLVMVAAVLAAAPLSLLLARDARWLRSGCALAFALACTALLALALGYGGPAPPTGFGMYSMNLLSPFYPYGSALLPGFRLLPDATGGQYFEGYQYLGMGLLLLSALALACLACQRCVTGLGRHLGLLIVAVLLTALAVSSVVALGHRVLASWEDVPRWFNQFRSSSRFFWPVAYAVMLGCVVLLARALPPRTAGAVLAGAAVLQFADAATLRRHVHDQLRSRPAWAIDATRLRPLLAAHDQLTLWPSSNCGSTEPKTYTVFTQLLLLASEYRDRTNTMLLARSDGATECLNPDLLDRPIAPGELRVLLPQVAASALAMPDGARWCRQLGKLAVCTTNSASLAALPPLQPGSIPLGTAVPVESVIGARVLGVGWEPPIFGGAWTHARSAVLTLRLDAPSNTPVKLTVSADDALLAAAGGTQRVTVRANGRTIAVWELTDGEAHELSAVVPAQPEPRPILNIRFDVARPLRPIDVQPPSTDERWLGLSLHWFRFDPLPAAGGP